MATCSTCGEMLTLIDLPLALHCRRCGTAMGRTGNEVVPELVTQLVEFCATLTEDDQAIIDRIEALGIRDMITPEGIK